jgi:hypothetical protein
MRRVASLLVAASKRRPKQLEGNMLEHTCRGDDAMTPPSMRT